MALEFATERVGNFTFIFANGDVDGEEGIVTPILLLDANGDAVDATHPLAVGGNLLDSILGELNQKLEPAHLAALATAAKQDALQAVLDEIAAAVAAKLTVTTPAWTAARNSLDTTITLAPGEYDHIDEDPGRSFIQIQNETVGGGSHPLLGGVTTDENSVTEAGHQFVIDPGGVQPLDGCEGPITLFAPSGATYCYLSW